MRWIRVLLATAGAAACLLLLWSLTQIDGVPAIVVVALMALAALAAWRPDAGLLATAVFVPLASWLGRRWNYQVTWAETIVVAAAAGLCARAVVRREGSARTIAPVVALALVVAASLAEQLWALQLRIGTDTLVAQLGALARSDYFVNRGFTAVDFSMRLLEGLLLFQAAATVARTDPTFPRRMAQAICLAAAVAAAVTATGLWSSARQSATPFATLARFIATVRWNEHYGDLNAAGSYFVMALLTALGLVRGGRAWIVPAAFIALGLWIAGSRTAMLAGVTAALIVAVPLVRRSSRRSLITVAGMAVIIAAASFATIRVPRGNQIDSLTATRVRAELAATSLRMTGSHPLTGVGIGQYRLHSGTFSSPELLRLFPPARDENAHNNFLQILAELGLLGFGALLWLLGAAARRVTDALRPSLADGVRWGIAAGLTAFVLTWLGGHPLLIDEPAMTFWLLLGAIAGVAPEQAQSGRGPRTPFLVVLAAALAVSVPWRARQQIAAADLEHVGIGVSTWQRGEGGMRYRTGGTTSTVFIPADAPIVVIPLRSAVRDTELRVRLTLDGRPADIVRVPADRWYELRLVVPPTSKARFRRLEFLVEDAPSGEAALLMIGKVEPR